MIGPAVALLAILLAIVLGYAVHVTFYRPKHTAEFLRIKSQLARAEKQHKPRRHLWKALVETRRKELAS